MKKKYRILKNTEFQKIKNSKKFTEGKFVVIYPIAKKLNHSRIGISVSKKIGNAVVRNKIKRQIRSIFSMNLDFDSLKNDYLVFPRASYNFKNFIKIKEEILALIKKVEK